MLCGLARKDVLTSKWPKQRQAACTRQRPTVCWHGQVPRGVRPRAATQCLKHALQECYAPTVSSTDGDSCHSTASLGASCHA